VRWRGFTLVGPRVTRGHRPRPPKFTASSSLPIAGCACATMAAARPGSIGGMEATDLRSLGRAFREALVAKLGPRCAGVLLLLAAVMRTAGQRGPPAAKRRWG
jgi:hypothetical protein